MTPAQVLNQPFTLPCGVTIPNRIVKSAMSENNADLGGKLLHFNSFQLQTIFL